MTVLFWDFDGTLVIHLKSLWTSCVHRALQEVDPQTSVTFEQLQKSVSGVLPWDDPKTPYPQPTHEQWWEQMNLRFEGVYRAHGVAEAAAREAAKRVRPVLKSLDNYKLYEDALSTLRSAREKGCLNVILSNNYPDMGEMVEALGLTELLDGMIVSAVEGYEKPRQELFDIAKRRYPADRYFMIGDNPVADIGGGRAAGMTTVLVHRGYFDGADFCFDDLRSVLALL